MGNLLAAQPGREDEAEAAYRAAIDGGDDLGWYGLGYVLHRQRKREAAAEAAYRKAIDAGYIDGWLGVGNLLAAQPGREDEAEAAYRAAIDGGDDLGWLGVGTLLSKQPGREDEAEAAYRGALAAGVEGENLEKAALSLGGLLVRQGDVEDARAAFEVYARAFAKRHEVDLADSTIATLAALGVRFRTAVARRPWALPLVRSPYAVARLGSEMMRRWRWTRGRARRSLDRLRATRSRAS